jgi:DNA polymerase-1
MQPVIIVDSSSLCYAAKFTLSLDYDGVEVGIIFSFLRQIIKLAKTFNTNQFVFTWDSRESIRKKYFPAYKGNRHTKELTEEEKEFDSICYKQFNKLKDTILPEIGFTSYYQTGYEADDLIASIVFNNPEGNKVIATNDNDLYQLLSQNTSLFHKELYTIDNFEKEYDIAPNKWVYVKSLAGCSSDSIPGIEKIGVKTAIKYLKKELKVTSNAYQQIQRNKKTADFNLPLVSLPYPGTNYIKLPKEYNLSYKNYVSILTRYGFRSMLTKESLEQCQNLLKL